MKTNINIDTFVSRLEEIYDCGRQQDGTYTRMAYSPENQRGREVFAGYFENLRIPLRVDEAGNLIARMEGKEKNLPAIVIGSYLDTVPDGGKYDGVVGCVAGLTVCEALLQNRQQLRHPLEVIVFTDEEGFRFGSGMVGSSAMCGEALEICVTDIYGQSRKEVFENAGIDISKIINAKRNRGDIHCFLEMHVEQGASLCKNRIPVGVVSSIAGVSRYEVVITGQANHAGSAMMEDRKDALVAAAKFIADVPEMVKMYGNPFTVATVGTIKVTPNSVNVIPGTCEFFLEIRDQSEEVMFLMELKLKERLKEICEETKESFRWEKRSYHKPAPMNQTVKNAIEEAVKRQKTDYAVIPSGAFHDALLMSTKFPTGMIFVPSEDGISHSRYEYTKPEDIKCGVECLIETVLIVDEMDVI